MWAGLRVHISGGGGSRKPLSRTATRVAASDRERNRRAVTPLTRPCFSFHDGSVVVELFLSRLEDGVLVLQEKEGRK